MKRNVGTVILILGLVGNLSMHRQASADADPRMVELFSRQAHEFEVGISQGNAPDHEHQSLPPPENSMNFVFRNFYLRTRASFAFEIPSILKLAIVPETELVWQRPWPAGYTGYRPSR